jgi:hypothetical protein
MVPGPFCLNNFFWLRATRLSLVEPMEGPYIFITEVLKNGWRAILLLSREDSVWPVVGFLLVLLIGN